MRIEDLEYHADGTRMVGQYAIDDAKEGHRPGAFVERHDRTLQRKTEIETQGVHR